MACEHWRDLLSAQLDGEGDPADRERVDEHLAGCADCRAWLDQAALVNRLTRTASVTAVPDLSETIMAAVRARPRRRFNPALLYLALAGVGAVQLILGLGQVGGGSSEHVHVGVDAASGHLWHESAAWNVAIGTAYLFIALRRNRPSGLVPMLTAFVGMLLLLSVNDLSGDRVDVTRLVSHGFVILGYLLVVAIVRTVPTTAQPPGSRLGSGSSWRADFPDDQDQPAPGRPRLRLVPRGPLTASEDPDRKAA